MPPKESIDCPFKDSGSKSTIHLGCSLEPESFNGQSIRTLLGKAPCASRFQGTLEVYLTSVAIYNAYIDSKVRT